LSSSSSPDVEEDETLADSDSGFFGNLKNKILGGSAEGASSGGPDLARAQALSQLSAITYCPIAKINRWGNPAWTQNAPGWTLIKAVELPGTGVNVGKLFLGATQLYYLARDGNGNLAIVFRGTKKLFSWVQDAEATQTPWPCPGCAVHYGFLQAWLPLKSSAIADLISQLKTPLSGQLLIVGQSLGAAIATMAALDIQAGLAQAKASGAIPAMPSIHVWVYGSPRVGNPAFVSFYNNAGMPTYRFVNGNDAVTYVPPASIAGLSYRHVDRLVWAKARTTNAVLQPAGTQSVSGLIPNPLDHGYYMGIDYIPYAVTATACG